MDDAGFAKARRRLQWNIVIVGKLRVDDVAAGARRRRAPRRPRPPSPPHPGSTRSFWARYLCASSSGRAWRPPHCAWQGRRVFAFTTSGTSRYTDIAYEAGDVLLFGTEPTGLPEAVLADPHITEQVRIPMLPGRRSMNLSNAAAVTVYEAWRQHGFAGSAGATGLQPCCLRKSVCQQSARVFWRSKHARMMPKYSPRLPRWTTRNHAPLSRRNDNFWQWCREVAKSLSECSDACRMTAV